MPRHEAQRADAEIDDNTAARLVAFALSPGWSDYWAGRAVDWVDDGVTSDAVVEAQRAATFTWSIAMNYSNTL